MSLISGLTLLGAEIAAGQTYTHPIFYLLNTLVRTLFYVVVVYLVAELQKSRKEEQLAARTDFITGAVNARYFNELLQMEISRIRRYPHPITLVYVDVDNFKLVNDLFGHKIGDEVLRCIASRIKSLSCESQILLHGWEGMNLSCCCLPPASRKRVWLFPRCMPI